MVSNDEHNRSKPHPPSYQLFDFSRKYLFRSPRREVAEFELETEFEKWREAQQQEKQESKKEGVANNNTTTNEESEEIHNVVKFPASSLRGATWPDPDPVLTQNSSTGVMVDDVTRMNATKVQRTFQVRNEEDVKHVLALARSQNVKVSMRGTQHSMGGHTIAPNGFVIDTGRMKSMKYDAASETVVVGPGVRWSDLIYYLNRFGMSPHTMQSYSSFSVGGTVAVNAHGITSDLCCHESVVQIRLVKADGEVAICKPESELFSCAVGGYGMFGIMTEITLKCVPNSHIFMDMIRCKVDTFPGIYKRILEDVDKDIELKLARLDTTNFEDINFFVFRKTSDIPTVSALPLNPSEMSVTSQILYKWIAPSGDSLRYAIERYTGRAVDWSDRNERNLLMYESAEPLAKMYSPLFQLDDTFILQEYFVPYIKFRDWIAAASKLILPHQATTRKYFTLLNTTIRFVQQDNCTKLAYSRAPGGSFAFVLYFRMKRTAEADGALKKLHHDLIQATLKLGGVFYLPYRHHYTDEQLKAAYPDIGEFFSLKEKYDPHGLFDSMWFTRYGQKYFNPKPMKPQPEVMRKQETLQSVEVVHPRSDSYRKVFSDPELRKQFFEAFLVQIFNIENSTTIKNAISRALWDPQCHTDRDIYAHIQASLQEHNGALAALTKAWKTTSQLHTQKRELLRETSIVLARLNLLGDIQDYVSIGDQGKMVLAFREALSVKGKVYVVHDQEPTPSDIPAILERGSLCTVGEFVRINYDDPTSIDLPDCCTDLVTMNQGLHHLPQEHLLQFICEVYRILRPGGVFIVREHDASPSLTPLLDIAHSIYNAVTGVKPAAEITEVRAFRSVHDWRRIIESTGFYDSLVYEMEKGDPTLDEMMAFCKPGCLSHRKNEATTTISSSEPSSSSSVPLSPLSSEIKSNRHIKMIGDISMVLNATLNKIPNALLNLGQYLVDGLIQLLDILPGMLKGVFPSLAEPLILQTVEQTIKPIKTLLTKFRPYLNDVKLQESGIQLIPQEAFLLLQAFLVKHEMGEETLGETVVITLITKFLDALMPSSSTESTRTATTPSTVSTKEVSDAIDRLFQAMPNMLDEESLNDGGLGFLSRILRSYMQNMTGEHLAPKVVPYLDKESWSTVKIHLEKIIADPANNEFTMDNITMEGSNWYHVAMKMLASPLIQLNSFRIPGYWLGVGPIIAMWDKAQKTSRRKLSESTCKMLGAAVELSHLRGNMDKLIEALEHSGIISESEKKKTSAEYTWYKLVEWMQVEFVQIFGSFMVHTPWYRFPFMKFLQVYFSVLVKEFKVVNETHGLSKAAFSSAFFVDLVPGVVMAFLLLQMQLLATPLKLSLGDEYSEEEQASQVEHLIVTTNLKSSIDWEDIDPRIKATQVVPGLYKLTVPSLGPFTEVITAMAAECNEDVCILRISQQDEIQIRVAVKKEEDLQILNGIKGCSVKFCFQLPTDGKQQGIPATSVAVGVKVVHLLACIRECTSNGFNIEQIYDFWG